MKKVLLLLCIFPWTLFGQQITGEWHGLIQVQGMKLRIVFHISQTGTVYTATMDSPDQGAKGIPMTAATYANDTLSLNHDMAAINYKGVVVGKDSVAGVFKQGSFQLPLGLSRKMQAITQTFRPQNPTLPYPYRTEEVTFTNTDGNFSLAGTLTMPATGKNFPAVVLISGSGPQNRDEELMGHKPFLIWADYLTRKGFAVLRFDDRGCYQSKGDFSTATTFDFATDAEAALNYLSSRKEINPKKIGLMGHSEGGIIAPMVASRNKHVAFVVMLAGTGIQGKDILLQQQALIAKASGMSDKDIATNGAMNADIFEMVDKISQEDSLKAHLNRYLRQKANELPELRQQKDNNELFDSQLKKILNPWMLNFIRYNPAPMLAKVKCPVLALIGSNDLQVPADTNLPAIAKALKSGGNKQYKTVKLPGLNHLFQESKTGAPTEYGSIEQTVSPVAMDTVLQWLQTTINR